MVNVKRKLKLTGGTMRAKRKSTGLVSRGREKYHLRRKLGGQYGFGPKYRPLCYAVMWGWVGFSIEMQKKKLC